MTQEKRTRDEVLDTMSAQSQSLAVLNVIALQILQEVREQRGNRENSTGMVDFKQLREESGNPAHQEPVTLGPPLSNPAEMNPVKQRKPRAPKPETEPSIPVTVAPVKPGKTPADLREALVSYVAKHGMPAAKEKLAPYTNISAVPDSEIDAVIARLTE